MSATSNDILDWARKAANAVYLVAPEQVAKELSDGINRLAARVRELEARVESMLHDDWGSLTRERDALRAALIYHQEQTRPIQRTIDVLAGCSRMDDIVNNGPTHSEALQRYIDRRNKHV